MGTEYRAKIFKSGNSVAVRFPKALGFAEGEEVAIIPHADGGFTIWKTDDPAAFLDGLFGSMSDGYMADGRGMTEQDERDWTGIAGSDAA